MVTKPFKIGPFGMSLRLFFFVFVLMELVPGAKDQDSAVFLMFFDVFFYVFLCFHQNSLGEHPQNVPPDQNDRLT